MAEEITYTVDEARGLLPEVRGTLLQIALERRNGEAALDVIRSLLEHLASLGVVVRDLETGLVDFPTRRDGERAWLCWRLDDPDLAWWHSTTEGFASRRPL